MNTALLDRAHWLSKGITSSKPGTRWDVIGGIGFGKSTMLRTLKPILADGGYMPILLDPPRRNFDTGAAAMTAIVDGLADANMLNVDAKALMSPDKLWSDKLAVVKKTITEYADRVVLLCDEPMLWAINARDDSRCETYSNHHAREISKWLQGDVPFRTVISNMRNLYPDHMGQHQLPKRQLDWRDLASTSLNAELETLESRIGPGFSSRSYLAMQLLAVYAAFVGIDEALLLNAKVDDVEQLAKVIVDHLQHDKQQSELLKVATRISLSRGNLNKALIETLGGGDLDANQRAILFEGMLCTVDEENYRMHSELERVIPVKSILDKSEIATAHKLIAVHYESLSLNRRIESKLAYSEDVEHFFHQAVSGNANWDSSTYYFVDQLHAWGRYLSHDAREHGQAAEVFRRAVEIDSKDDYAHHYLAYNLDCLAVEEERARHHYLEAVNLNLTHPWWWSRWINFLITTGRMDEAREQLTRGRIELGLDTGDTPTHIFHAFHKWVVRLLLHRSQLDLAERLLADADEDEVIQFDVGFRSMRTMLSNLKFTRDGWDVLPVYVDPNRDWTQWPFIDKPGRFRNLILKAWNPAKVVGIGQDAVDLLVGKQVERGEHRFGRIEIPREEFFGAIENVDPESVDEGSFVELSFYGDENRLRVDVFQTPRDWAAALPSFDPPNPARYLESWHPRA